jgi:hypothetical protein
MCGWLSAEMLFASRSKRWRRSGSPANSGGRTLMAAVRARRVSRALLDFAHTRCPVRVDYLIGPEPRADR